MQGVSAVSNAAEALCCCACVTASARAATRVVARCCECREPALQVVSTRSADSALKQAQCVRAQRNTPFRRVGGPRERARVVGRAGSEAPHEAPHEPPWWMHEAPREPPQRHHDVAVLHFSSTSSSHLSAHYRSAHLKCPLERPLKWCTQQCCTQEALQRPTKVRTAKCSTKVSLQAGTEVPLTACSTASAPCKCLRKCFHSRCALQWHCQCLKCPLVLATGGTLQVPLHPRLYCCTG